MLRRRATAGVGCLLAAAAVAAAAAAPTSDAVAADDGGVIVAPDVPVTANDLHAPRGHNSPVLAVDPTDERFAAIANRLDDPDFSCALHLSGDGGRSWVGAEVLVGLPEGVDKCYAPQVVFDATGMLYYLFVGLAGAGNTPQGVWLTSSRDRGRTFIQPWQVLGPDNYQVRLAIDAAMGEQGRLHLVWLAPGERPGTGALPASRNPIVAAYSDDGGRSFSEPVEVSGPEQRRVVAPAVAVGADGAVHVLYYDLRDDARDYQGLEGPAWSGTWAVEVASSYDGGASFAAPIVVDDALRPFERVMLIFTMPPPTVAADDAGNVYAGWHDARDGDADVFVAASGDHGRSWGEPARVNDDERGSRAHQLLPKLAAAPDGRLDVVFLDRRADPDNVRQHVLYAASHDAGRSFSANRRLTSADSDARSGPRYHLPAAQGQVELGAGLALHAADRTVVAAWPDTRFAVPGTAQQDVYATTVQWPSATLPGWWPTLVVGGLVLAAAVGLLIVRRRRRAAAANPATATPSTAASSATG